jgi:hypothetical protein
MKLKADGTPTEDTEVNNDVHTGDLEMPVNADLDSFSSTIQEPELGFFEGEKVPVVVTETATVAAATEPLPTSGEVPAVVTQTTEAAVASEPAQAVVVDDVTQMRSDMARMAEIMAKHGLSLNAPAASSSPGATPASAQAAPVATVHAPAAEMKLFESPEEFEQMLTNPELFHKKATAIRDAAVEQVLGSVPILVGQMVQQALEVRETVRDFYEGNKDLIPFKPFVALVAQEIAAAEPELKRGEVFAKTATEVRKRLAIKANSTEPTPPAPRAPGLPGARTGTRAPGAPELKGLEKDIFDTIS